jgi:hypothetical protein
MDNPNSQIMYQRPMQGMASQLASQGRYGDSMMVHMNPVEVAGLASLSPTGSLTTNPMTGQPEAFLPFLGALATAGIGSLAGGALAGGLGLGTLGTLAAKGITTEALSSLVQGRGFDPTRALASGVTQFGIDKAVGAANIPTDPKLEAASKSLADATKLETGLLNTGLSITPEGSEALKTLQADAFSDVPIGPTSPVENIFKPNMSPVPSPKIGAAQLGATPNIDSIAYKQQMFDTLASESDPMANFRRDPSMFAKEFGKGLMDPAAAIPIAVGEGQIAQIDAQERMKQYYDDQNKQKEQEAKRIRAGQQQAIAAAQFDNRLNQGAGMIDLNPYDDQYNQLTPQTMFGYGGGITSLDPRDYMNKRRSLQTMGVEPVKMFPGGTVPTDYFQRFMQNQPGGQPADIQRGLRGPRTVTREELQAESDALVAEGRDPRAGFREEILYFRDPLPDPEKPIQPNPDPDDPSESPIGLPGLDLNDRYPGKFGNIGGTVGGRKGTNFYRQQQENMASGLLPTGSAGLPQIMAAQRTQNLPTTTATPVEGMQEDFSSLMMGEDGKMDMEELRKRISGMNLPFAKGGDTSKFPDLNKDGEVTQADILMGRGVIDEKQEGGQVSGQEDPLINLTMEALMGRMSPQEMDTVIKAFIDRYGNEAFQQLRSRVLQDVVPNAQTEGQIQGQGGGMDDNINGMIGADQPVAVSPNEYIVAADVVSGLGDGNSDEGARLLDEMMDRVRMDRTGTVQQPEPLNTDAVMPA